MTDPRPNSNTNRYILRGADNCLQVPIVIPAKAGIQRSARPRIRRLDPRFRGGDELCRCVKYFLLPVIYKEVGTCFVGLLAWLLFVSPSEAIPAQERTSKDTDFERILVRGEKGVAKKPAETSPAPRGYQLPSFARDSVVAAAAMEESRNNKFTESDETSVVPIHLLSPPRGERIEVRGVKVRGSDGDARRSPPSPLPSHAGAGEGGSEQTFTFESTNAKRVAVAGEFNNWSKDALEMTKTEGGKWVANLPLKPGRYEYKYVVDGDWTKGNQDNRIVTVKKENRSISNAVQTTIPAHPEPAAVNQALISSSPLETPHPASPSRGEEVTKKHTGSDKTIFRYKNPDAKDVGIGSEFNQWKWESSRMTKGPDGVWTLTMELPPGDYAYKFVVDGDWREHRETPLKKPVDGSQNSMIRVTAAAAAAAVEEGSVESVDPGVKILSDGSVRFVYKDPAADQVYLSGSFNNWLPDAWPMMKRADGLWMMSVKLKPGVYTYKYYSGGVWKPDPANPKTRDAGYGPDSVIDVWALRAGGEKVPTTFRVEAVKSKRVTLTGDFNGWDPGGIDLRSNGGGEWSVTIDLLPGKYDYKFLADGDRTVLNRENRKIEVK